jgi:hypothetical protein
MKTTNNLFSVFDFAIASLTLPENHIFTGELQELSPALKYQQL